MYEITEQEQEQAKIEAMFFIKTLSKQRQKDAVRAVKDLLEQGKDWYWIKTALHKKGALNWERFGFGLMFMPNFNNSVLQQINREQNKDIDVDEFFSGYEEQIEEYRMLTKEQREKTTWGDTGIPYSQVSAETLDMLEGLNNSPRPQTQWNEQCEDYRF